MQSVLGKGWVNTFPRQRIHTINLLLGTVFFHGPCKGVIMKTIGSNFDFDFDSVNHSCGGGFVCSTVTLRVVGGGEGGGLESETVKYNHESRGTRTREGLRWRGPAAFTKNRPVLSSERTAHKNKTVTVKE
jgi:hypothetical protein